MCNKIKARRRIRGDYNFFAKDIFESFALCKMTPRRKGGPRARDLCLGPNAEKETVDK